MNFVQLLTNNNKIVFIILAFICSLIQGILFYKISQIILNLTNNKKERNIFIIITVSVGLVLDLISSSSLNDIVNIVLFIVLMHFLLHQSIKSSFIALIFSYMGTLLSTYIASILLTGIFNINTVDLLNTPVYYALLILFYSILFMLFTFIVQKVKYKNLILHIKLSLKSIVVVNLTLGIIAIGLESYILSKYSHIIPTQITLSMIIVLLLYFFISMYSIIRTHKLEKTEADLENEKIYNKTLTLLHDNIRGFKHDFNNIVQVIGGYISLNDMDGLNEYYKHLLKECKITNNLNILNPETINNPSIYSLLTNKYYTATQKNINMTFSIFTDLSKINFNMYEISRILGILLDNAIEAAEETENKIIEIEFTSDNRRQLFIIRNSCKDSNISTTKIFEKGYSTKNRNSGIGLWKVHNILSKNTNLDLYTTIKDNIFSQQLEVFY